MSKKKFSLYIGSESTEDEIECFYESLNCLLENRQLDDNIRIECKNIGWTKANGCLDHRFKTLDTGKELLQTLGIAYDCSITVTLYQRGITINVKHHDNPVNGDEYIIRRIK